MALDFQHYGTDVTWGWLANGGDPAFGRLAAKRSTFRPHLALYSTAPLSRHPYSDGNPGEASLLVLTGFKALVAHQSGGDAKSAIDLFQVMMQKSLVGYAIAFVLGLVIFLSVLRVMERRIHEEGEHDNTLHPVWTIFQWLSTGFLWSMWLVQDLANIFVYLPRELTWWGLALSLGGMVLLQGYIFREKGGKIQNIVTAKTNTLDVRSATFIDLLYGLVLLFFKVDYIPQLFEMMGLTVPWPPKMPMSTTWVFLGLIAGREIGIAISLRHRSSKKVTNLVCSDAGKAFAGSVIAVMLALFLPLMAVFLHGDTDTEEAIPPALEQSIQP